ncbi:MAG: hypothetical protein KGH98_04720 [Candidatus Micrarchaeota archaeon]|nr:hypothetical protein [Candidatus Micrarchaeota archaeon]
MLEGKKLVCINCGVETPSHINPTFCPNCESAISIDRATLTKNDPERIAALDAINAGVASGDFESAAASYDRMITKNPEPGLVYASGILHIKWSNHVLNAIDYGQPGYMESNSATIDLSNAIASRSRSKFTHVVETYKLDQSHQDSLSYAYTVFLSQIKLGNYQNAKSTAARIPKMGSAEVSDYSGAVLDAHTGRYDSVLKYTDSLVAAGKLYPNAAFYAALAMFNKRMDRDALQLATSLRDVIGPARVDRLIGKINALGRISEGPISI